MRSYALSLSLACALASAALVAACGGSAPPPEVPTQSDTPKGVAKADDKPKADDKSDDKPKTDAKPDDKPKDDKPAAAKGGMPEVTASKMADDLKAAGLDIAKLPKMAAMKQAERVKVMTVIGKATGMACKDCHVDGDNKKETPMKGVARKMWDDYVVGMKLSSGPLFCDSCHQGGHGFLDRKNKDAVSAYMDAQFSKKLSAKGGKSAGCDTCHGSDVETNIFEKVWKIKGAPHAMIPAGEQTKIADNN